MLSRSFQHQSQVCQLIPNQTIHCPIIYVYLKKFLNKIFECSDNNPGEYSRCILQPKRHHGVLEATPFSNKCHFMLILFCHPYLVITKKSICKRVHFMSAYSFEYFICEWCWKWIMHTCIIQFSQINIDLNFSCFLVLNHHRTNPF